MKLYPDRHRCFACRRYFDFIVVRGLYCSWTCAGMEEPSLNPQDWPREHFKRDGDGFAGQKRTFLSEGEAEAFAREELQGKKEPYLCGYCGMWHIGTPRGDGKTR